MKNKKKTHFKKRDSLFYLIESGEFKWELKVEILEKLILLILGWIRNWEWILFCILRLNCCTKMMRVAELFKLFITHEKGEWRLVFVTYYVWGEGHVLLKAKWSEGTKLFKIFPRKLLRILGGISDASVQWESLLIKLEFLKIFQTD